MSFADTTPDVPTVGGFKDTSGQSTVDLAVHGFDTSLSETCGGLDIFGGEGKSSCGESTSYSTAHGFFCGGVGSC